MTVVKEDTTHGVKIEVKRFEKENEVYLLCRSQKKKKKEESMRTRIESLFIKRLIYLKTGLTQPKKTKKYNRIVESIGRLKEKYPKVAKLYEIIVVPEKEKASDDSSLKALDIRWQKKIIPYQQELQKEGQYILRTDRNDLKDKEIFNIYNLLRQIEYSFLCMKSHLGLRPNFHSKEDRIDAHLFISVVAYHILHLIEYRLKEKGDNRKWATVKDVLRTHQRITINIKVKNSDDVIVNQKIRMDTQAEPAHAEIYRALGMNVNPLPKKITSYKV